MPNATQSPATEADQAKEFTAPEDEFSKYMTEMRDCIVQNTTTRQFAFNRAKNNYQMYRGLIGRPQVDMPYEGSSDIRYRLSTLYIRQTRSGFTNAILQAPKLVRFTPKFGKVKVDQKLANESADKQEAYSDTIYRSMVKDFHNIVDFAFSKLAIDGRCVAKVMWNIETRLATEERERQPFQEAILQAQIAKYQQMMSQAMAAQKPPTAKEIADADLTEEETETVVANLLGWDEDTERYEERIDSVLKQIDANEDFIEVIVDRVVNNGPMIQVTNYEDIIVPDDTTRIAEAEWIAQRLRFSKRAFCAKDVKNGGNYKGAEEILDEDYAGAVPSIEQRQMDNARRKAEGIQFPAEQKESVNVIELYCWVKRSWIKRFNGKTNTSPDLTVRAVITFCPDAREGADPVVLRCIELPYNHGEWPFVDWFYNQTDKRFYENEGIVGLLWPLELEFNIARNAAINRTTLAMSPPGFYMEESGFQPQSHRQLGQMHAIDDQAYIASQGMPARFLEYPQALTALPNYDANDAKSWASDVVGIPNMSSLMGYSNAPTQEQVQQVTTPAAMIQQHEVANWLDRWGRVYWMIHELCKQYLFLDGTEEIQFTNQDTQEGTSITKQDFSYDFIVVAGGDPSMESPVLLAQKRALVMQQYVQNPALAPYGDMYEAWYTYVHHTLPFNEASSFVPPREKAEAVNQQFLQMQSQAMAMRAEGKRPPKQERQLQLSNAYSGLRPK